jgi:hypothetical protein
VRDTGRWALCSSACHSRWRWMPVCLPSRPDAPKEAASTGVPRADPSPRSQRRGCGERSSSSGSAEDGSAPCMWTVAMSLVLVCRRMLEHAAIVEEMARACGHLRPARSGDFSEAWKGWLRRNRHVSEALETVTRLAGTLAGDAILYIFHSLHTAFADHTNALDSTGNNQYAARCDTVLADIRSNHCWCGRPPTASMCQNEVVADLKQGDRPWTKLSESAWIRRSIFSNYRGLMLPSCRC